MLKSKGLEKILIKYIQISKQIYSDKLFQVVSFLHTQIKFNKQPNKNFKSISPTKQHAAMKVVNSTEWFVARHMIKTLFILG